MIANQNPRVEPVLIDILQRPDHMKTLVEAADLVISLLPFQLHHLVAECCISAHTNMVTASYCTLDMMRLHDKYALVYVAISLQFKEDNSLIIISQKEQKNNFVLLDKNNTQHISFSM